MTNNGSYLSYSFQTPTDNIAKLDNETFYLNELQVYTPSLHTFNGTHQIGELLMIHYNSDNIYYLIISIPITQFGTSDIGFNNLLNLTKTHINSAGETYSQLVPDLNMNHFIAKKEYYTSQSVVKSILVLKKL
jgi:carbonic anhydrase